MKPKRERQMTLWPGDQNCFIAEGHREGSVLLALNRNGRLYLEFRSNVLREFKGTILPTFVGATHDDGRREIYQVVVVGPQDRFALYLSGREIAVPVYVEFTEKGLELSGKGVTTVQELTIT